MAYQIDIATDHDPPFTDNLGVEIVEFALSFDLEADTAIVMSVMLVPVDEPKAHDLRFGIREQSLVSDWKVTAPDYSKESVDKYSQRNGGPLLGYKSIALLAASSGLLCRT
ncbi:hypothetical protein RPMA_18000 [Tardiphaga alba]|uniref:Uncharacterized protein n=1 Tax=Tardiphaga alba TaxID=340268 RepID=A0ABX8A9S6_9BRAD|nr:hypothetical protein [Tardiphaga alba]QUS40514.1 hypothetical protein RPMA_18000 [Tardiphaga alba]